jgi:uncharacterized protein (DUF1778 family)
MTTTHNLTAPPWWKPVRAAQVPPLRERIITSVRYYLMASLTLRTLFFGVYASQLEWSHEPWLWLPGSTLLVLALALGSSLLTESLIWHQRALVWSELCLFLLWALYNSTQAPSWIVGHNQLALLPLILASVPMRPAAFWALGCCYGVILSAENFCVAPLPTGEAFSGLAASLVAGAAAGVAAQLQRHMMASMERQSQQYISRQRLFTLGQQTQLMLGPLMTPLQEARLWLGSAHRRQGRLLDQAARWQAEPLQGHQEAKPLGQAIARSRGHLEEVAQRLTTLQEQTSGLHRRTSSRFLLREPLEEAHQACPRRRGVALALRTPEVPIEVQGDRQKLTQLFGVLLDLLHEHGLHHGQATSRRAEIERLTEQRARITLEQPSLAPLDPQSHLGFLARDLARGAFEGELSLHHEGQAIRLVLLVSLHLEEVQGQQFTPGFQTPRQEASRAHQPR